MIITISNDKYIIGNNHDMGIIILFFIILMPITKPNCRCIISSNCAKNLTLFLFFPHDFCDEKRFKNYVSFCWYIRLPEMAAKKDKGNGFTSRDTH